MAVIIDYVEAGSAAMRAGLCAGMQLVALDGHPINDGLDYEFYSAPAKLAATVIENGVEQTLQVVKQEYEPLGCGFPTYLIDKQHSCRNGCVFCFIDQLPKGMRAPLYFKDDDERLGFLFGNYITLTNLADTEIERIISMRISPVNISVHTVNPQLRVQMMKNKRSGDVLEYIPRLAAAGIRMNTQLVLCPGMNDGEELRRSIEWLAALRPAVQSIAAVPVGLTRHREGLHPLEAYTKETAAAQLDIMLEYGNQFLQQQPPENEEPSRLVYPSDEWFLLAGRPIPEEDFYDGYPQLENGVGMWRLLYEEFTQALEEEARAWEDEGVTACECGADLVVGALAAPLLRQLAALLEQKIPGAKLHVHEIRNDFFGTGVTVTGLLTGGDIMKQLQGRLQSKTLLLPASTLRAEGDIMLDGTTPEMIAQALGVCVEVVQPGGDNLLEAVLDTGEWEE